MSNKRKNSRKYKKELRIPEGHVVRFDYEEVQRLAEINGLQVFLKGNDTVLEIKSRINTWICNTDTKDVINLYHLTSDGRKHFQRSFLDYEFLLKSVRDHDIWKIEEDTGNKMFNIFKMIDSGNIPRVSFN